jgi:hypothetical protein
MGRERCQPTERDLASVRDVIDEEMRRIHCYRPPNDCVPSILEELRAGGDPLVLGPQLLRALGSGSEGEPHRDAVRATLDELAVSVHFERGDALRGLALLAERERGVPSSDPDALARLDEVLAVELARGTPAAD